MRRAAVAVIIGGYAFWGIGSGPGNGPGSGQGHQPAIVGARLTAAVMPATPGKPATKIVTYDGYAVSVPASWPVYHLDKDTHRCVRYDVHAVYLGTGGPDQNCPAGLIGRVDTLSIEDPAAPLRKTAGDRKAPAQRALTPGTVVRDPGRHELALAMPQAAPRIDATYGTGPGSVEQLLATVRPAAPVPASAVRTGEVIHAPRRPDVAHSTNPAWPKDPAPPTGLAAAWATPPSPPPVPKAAPAPRPEPTGPVLAGKPAPATTPKGTMAGFDTCTAPPLPTMKAWQAKYAATAIYIGGQMLACGQGNLSASWVRQAEAMGWSLLPTFVGLQAPCDTFSGKIDPRQAAAQGSAAATQAIAAAGGYGLGPGSPVYYDMEAYDHTNAGCRTAVLTFLDAWTRQLEAGGYVPGVYSSADAAIIDLQSTATIAGHSLAEPQAVWFALWDNANNLTGTPYMTSAVWPVASRSKQYAGNRAVTVGGISLDIDADWVASAVARG